MGLLDKIRTGPVPQPAPGGSPPRPAPLPIVAGSVLLASHGSEGARAAEDAVLATLAAGARLHHLLIVPEFWQHMSGDGWRINASTENIFCDYLEDQIERETMAELRRVHGLAKARGISYSAASRFGPLAASLIDEANAGRFDAIVMGAPRPRRMQGLRSRMDMPALLRSLRVPLIVVPHPRASHAA